MVKQLVLLRVSSLRVLKDSEASHQVVSSVISLVADCLVSVSGFLEESDWQLQCEVVSGAKDASQQRIAHPCLSHDRLGCFQLSL